MALHDLNFQPAMMTSTHLLPFVHRTLSSLTVLGLAGLLGLTPVHAADPHAPAPAPKPATAEASPKDMADQLRDAVNSGNPAKKRLTLIVNGKETTLSGPTLKEAAAATKKAMDEHGAEPATPVAAPAKPPVSQQYLRARAIALGAAQAPKAVASAHGHEVHWSYEGEGGPQAWGKLKPEFNTCANGKRQSPIHIEESMTLQGPAEAIQFNYQPSNGTVVNNGHTIQVDVVGDNSITVRGSTYKLLQFHFHNPSEERVNYKTYAMVAHLVHRNMEGQLAVVGVLMDPGAANSLINKVWTYMPLDSGDSVRMPAGLLDLNELLPKDQRYYQFMGSLTTPPCTEGVLWMVLKQPMALSPEQLRLFGQLYPNNARPVQPANNRPIRNAQ